MPKAQRKPVTITEMLEMSKGGERTSEYSTPRKDKKRKNPTKDLTIGGAVDNIRKGGRK